STHLPPPVIIERTADRAATTHMLCCSWGMYLPAAASSEKDHGSMNLASKTVSLSCTAVKRRAHPPYDWMPDSPLDVGDDLTGVGLIPATIELFGREPKLNNQVAR